MSGERLEDKQGGQKSIREMSFSARKQFSGDTERGAEVSALTMGDPVPEPFKEIIELMSSVNRRLEDCAVEWQSTVSRKQWRILDGNRTGADKSWEQSLLARTYFTEKSLDDAFQCLLSKDRTFTEQLNYFVALLRGDDTSLMTSNVRDAQSQCPDQQAPDSLEHKYPIVTPLDLTLLEERGGVRRTRKSKRLAAGNAIATIQQSFGDLVKAKINLDTKFLGFEAILNGSNGIPSTDESTTCLCQICSNVLLRKNHQGSAMEKGSMMKSIASVRQKVQRVTRARAKRLTKSTRGWTRGRAKNEAVSLNEIGDRATMMVEESYRGSNDD